MCSLRARSWYQLQRIAANKKGPYVGGGRGEEKDLVGNCNLRPVGTQLFRPIIWKVGHYHWCNVDDNCSFVSIGCPGRPFATADPRADDILPADDTAWDQGVSWNRFHWSHACL